MPQQAMQCSSASALHSPPGKQAQNAHQENRRSSVPNALSCSTLCRSLQHTERLSSVAQHIGGGERSAAFSWCRSQHPGPPFRQLTAVEAGTHLPLQCSISISPREPASATPYSATCLEVSPIYALRQRSLADQCAASTAGAVTTPRCRPPSKQVQQAAKLASTSAAQCCTGTHHMGMPQLVQPLRLLQGSGNGE